ncbi:ADP-ribosylglycohydrolase family protein [Myxococcota bacterium]|nr:ADP-ribosylglycohydrolase family protein [Myxococcota bacterium]
MHPSPDDALTDRATAAFLGLALGDAYGRPLEFVLLPEVRTSPVQTRAGLFHWTDDTHMSLFLARAVLDQPARAALDQDAFGRAVGRRFAEWAEDPLTPSTAPGSTCLRGARAFARHGDWQRSGDRGSDGCGAVMRVVPIALAFQGAELVDAARISSIVTHAHPNAVEAAIAGAWLCRQALLEGRLDEGLVARAVAHLRRDWDWGGEVAESLEAALAMADGHEDGWLDEEAMPPGDGGWRSASALGLAVAAALRWRRAGFATVVERAARIEGDSDSVAAIAGMLHGAAHGTRALPASWLEALPSRAEIAELARSLWARGAERTDGRGAPDEGEADAPTQAEDAAAEPAVAAPAPSPAPGASATPSAPASRTRGGPPVQLRLTGADAAEEDGGASPLPAPAELPAAPLTSLDHPLRVRWLDLAVAGPRAPRGRIGICGVPGRKDGVVHARTLGVDLDRLVALHQADLLVLLLDGPELAGLGVPDLVAEAEARRVVVHSLPVAPGAVPAVEAAEAALGLVLAVARAGRRAILVSRDGEERAGALAAAALVALGLASEAALRTVRAGVGPRAAASEAQRAFVMSRSSSSR